MGATYVEEAWLTISPVEKRSPRNLKCTHIFGIECPKTEEDALELVKQNDNSIWADAIAKKMKNVWVAFNVIEDGAHPPNRYRFVKFHLIVDVKMEDFFQKAMLVTEEHMTDIPAMVTNGIVVSRETACIPSLH